MSRYCNDHLLTLFPGVNENELADQLRALEVDESWIHEIARKQILHDQKEFTKMAVEQPELVTKELIDGIKVYLGDDYDVEKHFTPNYRPWRQRVALRSRRGYFQGYCFR